MANPNRNPLNKQQEEASKASSGPLLIVAGAGTGKTTTLTNRLIHLIELGIPAERICAITFTNKAAREMEERCLSLSSGCQGAFMGTFHSLGANILRQEAKSLGRKPNFVIFDDRDSFDLIKKIVKKEMWKDGGDDTDLSADSAYVATSAKGAASAKADAKKEKPSFFSRKISEIKNTESAFGELQKSVKEKDLLALKIYSIYESRLEENNAFDFDDLIEKVVHVFKKNPDVLAKHRERFDAVLVDEYQDVNPRQYELIKFLAENHKNLSVVGDDEQMIYGWRYANLKIFLGFERDWPGAQIKFLEENYRSTANIIEGASGVASNNNYRRPKNLWTKNPKGEPIKIFEAMDESDEANWIAKKISAIILATSKETVAILYRTNAQSRAIEQALIRKRIAYRIFGGLRFYERKEVKDIIAALRYATNKDEISFDRLQKNIYKKKFEKFWEKIKMVGDKDIPPAEWIESFLKTTDYLESLEKEFINSAERHENIKELLSFAAGFTDTHKFLEEITLMQPTDNMARGRRKAPPNGVNEVNLMTIHLAKGLEFDRVFLAGCSEGFLPHAMSMENEYQIEEERRLMYVAMTRAKKELHLSFYGIPSRFISEIPQGLMELENPPSSDFQDDVEEIYLE